jgi:hypothetical protein
MCSRHHCRMWVIAASVCAGAIASHGNLLSAAENEPKIRAELAKPTSIEFNETTLKDVVQYLKDLHSINIELDRKKLEEANVQLDMPITRVLKGVSFASALNLILEPLGLTYVIEHEVLLITSLAGAQRSSMPRVYEVAGLAADAEREALQKAVELVLDHPAAGDDGKPLPAASRMLVFRQKLILRGSQPEHDRVAELLTKLRESAKPTAVEPAPPPKETSTPRKLLRKTKLPLAAR